MKPPLLVPELVRQRAVARGTAGQRWLDDLPEVLGTVAARWGLVIGPSLEGGTASFVANATDDAGRACVLKVAMPAEPDDVDAFARAVLVHQLAGGRGCAELLAHDDEARAMLLERLGPNLHVLDMALADVFDAIVATLQVFWRPAPEDPLLPTGPDKASWLATFITTTWRALDRPCAREVIDRALAYCDERAAAFDRSQAVLVHGDAHGWNTLAASSGGFKLVDPEGLRSDRAHDLSVAMREYNRPLLDGDATRRARERAELLAARAGADPEAVWQWGFVERVSTGLANLRDFDDDEGKLFLEVATRCL